MQRRTNVPLQSDPTLEGRLHMQSPPPLGSTGAQLQPRIEEQTLNTMDQLMSVIRANSSKKHKVQSQEDKMIQPAPLHDPSVHYSTS